MCTPEAYVAGRLLQGYTQYKSDKEKSNRINQNTDAKAKTIRDEAIYKDNALIRQKENKEDQLTEQKLKLREQETQKKGQVKLAVFEKGIGGNLFNSLVGDVERQAGKDSNIIDQNYENYMYGMSQDRLAWNRRFTNQINNLPRAYKPTWHSYALSASMDIGSMYMANAAPTTPNASSGGQTFNLTYDNYNSPK
tara:strand:- start:1524 stop:2105 length:582 start_codon:yes stop_codon:yes gene_type:complete